MIDDRLKSLILTRAATEQDLAGIDPLEIRDVKASPDNAHLKGVNAPPIGIDEDRRVAKYVWTDESIDSDGDKIMSDGWSLKRYLTNPVFLWGHDRKSPPIGKALSIGIDPVARRGVMEVEFPKKGASEFADTIWELVQGGFLKATSAGFRITKVAELTDAQAKAEGIGKYGVKSLEQELYEVSQVSIGANHNALTLGLKGLVERGVVTDKNARDFERVFPLTERDMAARLKGMVRSTVDMGRASDQEGFVPLPEGFVIPVNLKGYGNDIAPLMLASAQLLAASKELIAATTKNIDALSDITRRIHAPGGSGGGDKPDAPAPDAQRLAAVFTNARKGFGLK